MARGRKTAKTAAITDALIIGFAQGIGTLPGISRSGITISTGMLRGYERSFAVRFSFLMSLPAVIGATILELKDAIELGLDPAILPYCAVGIVISAVVGYFAIRLVNLLASKGKFGSFAYYCWAVGILALVAGFIVK
jgi:undecaprenyl-diphosphatase